MKALLHNHRRWLGLALAGLLAAVSGPKALAVDSVCARVVIQIDQELTLERQGFEARLGINNGLPSSLDEFQVTLNFTDEDGNVVPAATDAVPNPDGKFYYRVQTGFSVPTTVAANTASKVAYLLVPAPGAAGPTAEGKLYYIGATIKYKVAGVDHTVQIDPDFIFVRPMPLLQLQYFLPGDVYGDDPFTDVKEPVVPFPVGVRVANHSLFATASQVKIESGQPEIIDNQKGLLVDFTIISCQVNAGVAQPSLLIDFGDILPTHAGVGAWQMTSSLSGKFVKFTAEVSHAAEFGGALTSLIPEDAISTHRLLGRVVVDLPGRDAVPDFLAVDEMTGDIQDPKVYESDNDMVSEPVDYFEPGNSLVNLTSTSGTSTLAVDGVSAMLLVRTTSPISADKVVHAVRSDGKVLPAANSWISKNKNDALQWEYWLNLFDTGKLANQSYALTFTDPPPPNRPPVLTIVGGRSFQIGAGLPFAFGVFAIDPDGPIPVLSTGLLPDGATFVDTHDGHGMFHWTPRVDQIGTYTVQFRAADETTMDTKSVKIQVLASVPPSFLMWQLRYWPAIADPLIVGPNADPDRDGVSNLVEYALGMDPTMADDSLLPQVGTDVVGGLHYLTLTHLERTDDPALRYEVVTSDSLTTALPAWTVQTQTVTTAQDNLPPGMARVKVRDSVAIETGPAQHYIRLRVTQPNPPLTP